MRYLLAGALGVALLAPARADDTKTDKPAGPPKALKEQVADTTKAYEKEMAGLFQQFQKAKTEDEKSKIGEKAMKQVTPDCLKKLMALAADHPKDPAAVDALLFVCTNRYLAGLPQAADAFKTLLKDHADSEQLGRVCAALAQRPDGDRMIREVRGKATNHAVKAQADFYLAAAILENDEATAAQTKEAQKLLEEFITTAKTVKGVPPDLADEARALVSLFIGKPAPATTSKDLDDKAVALADYKGKVVVLDFWATWCGRCRGMIPHEREMVKRNAGKPFVFVSISADEEKDVLTKFLKDEPMPWVHWHAGPMGQALKAWRITGFPTFVVIDAKGVIRAKIVGGGEENGKKLDDLVDKLVKEAR